VGEEGGRETHMKLDNVFGRIKKDVDGPPGAGEEEDKDGVLFKGPLWKIVSLLGEVVDLLVHGDVLLPEEALVEEGIDEFVQIGGDGLDNPVVYNLKVKKKKSECVGSGI
jgi:hypothetical protein